MANYPPPPLSVYKVGKLSLSLAGEIRTINDEVELWDDNFALKVFGQKAGVAVDQRSFSTALGVPCDVFLDSISMALAAKSRGRA